MDERNLEYLKDLRDTLAEAKMMVVGMKLNAAESSTMQLSNGLEDAMAAINQILKRISR